MDFDSLLANHTVNESSEKVIQGLSGELSAPRSNDDNNNHNNDRSQYRNQRNQRNYRSHRGHRNNYRHRHGRRGYTPRGEYTQVEIGTHKYDRIMGKYPHWDDLKWKSETAGNIVCTFEGKGQDNITIGLATELKQLKPMYEIVIGGWKDTKSVIRREAQGQERALCPESRLCSDASFNHYWVVVHDGHVSFGVGEEPGKQVLCAWKDPVPLEVQYVSFSGWDNTNWYRNIKVESGENVQMDQINFGDYMPEYLQKLESERKKQRERAAKFGTDYVEPKVDVLAKDVLTPQELEQMKQVKRGHGTQGFITGFDVTSEEEKKKAEERAKRFGVSSSSNDPVQGEEGEEDDEMGSRSKREERAKRFAIPVMEDVAVANQVIEDLVTLRVPRNDPDPNDAVRPDAINLYGNFDSLYTRDMLEWFGDYGASHVEWLHDCAVNIVFRDDFTAKRAYHNLSRDFPPIPDHQEGIDKLKEFNYKLAQYPLGQNRIRFLLIRPAAVSDVKAPKESGFRTTLGYQRGGSGFNNRRRNQYSEDRDRVTKAFDSVLEKRRREDEDDEDDDGENNEENNKKRVKPSFI